MTNEDKLALYGLFKQGNVGDVNTARPGMFDLSVSHVDWRCCCCGGGGGG